METTKVNKYKGYLKKCIGDNYKAGDEFTISSTAYAIVKHSSILKDIEAEGDLIEGVNKSVYKNPKYDILKYWKAEQEAGLKELGLTPKARKQILGSIEADSFMFPSETKTGRRKSKAQIEKERQLALEAEFC